MKLNTTSFKTYLEDIEPERKIYRLFISKNNPNPHISFQNNKILVQDLNKHNKYKTAIEIQYSKDKAFAFVINELMKKFELNPNNIYSDKDIDINLILDSVNELLLQ